MLARPFATACSSSPLAGGGNLQVIVDFKPGNDISDDMLTQLRRPFQGLADMGKWGGMAGEGHQPKESTLDMIINGKQVAPRCVRWDFDATNIDPGTAFVIQNMVHYLHLFVAPVRILELHGPLVRDGTVVSDELPIDYEPCPFTVHDDRESSTVMVDVDFCKRQAPLAADPFREAWDGWYEVAAHGGFCSEDYPIDEISIEVEDDLRVTSTGIGGVFEDVVIDDAGFCCLINMLQVLHDRLTPISEVTIE